VPDHELIRCIGRGSYGEVWLAYNVMGTYRAVKIVYRSSFENDRPFEREFSGIQKFEPISRTHEGLVDILQVGKNEAEGYFYYVMELADKANGPVGGNQYSVMRDPAALTSQSACGAALSSVISDPLVAGYRPRTLRHDLVNRGRLPFDECLQLGVSLTSALAHLHNSGLVHRDIKPSNIIFVNGLPKLADIGLVTDVGEARSFVGTEGFIPPEGPGKAQADIYSLGKVLYEISTGKDRQAFPEPPTGLVDMPDAKESSELNEVILKACESDTRKRYASAEAMRQDLLLLQSGRSVKRLHLVERRLAILTRVGVVLTLLALAGAGILYETNRARRAATDSLVRLHVANGTRLMNEGDLFGALLFFTEALRLDTGNAKREEPHRIRIASVLLECPKLVGVFTHEARITQDALSPDGLLVVTTSEDQTACVWDVTTGQLRFVLPHSGYVHSATFSSDGKLIATTSSDNRLHLWKAETGEPVVVGPIRHFARNGGPHPQFSPDGGRILTVDPAVARGTLRIWNVSTGEPMGQHLRHDGAVDFCAFSGDGQFILTISEDNQARVWNAFTGEKVYSFPHEGAVNCGSFSPDSRILATGGEDNCVRFWDLTSGAKFGQPLLERQPVDSLGFSPDGRRLVTACRNRTVEVWDLATGAPLLPRPIIHDLPVFDARFNPDGRCIVTASQGNFVRIWDADTGELIASPLKHHTASRKAPLNQDGHLILTIQLDEAVRVWDLARVEPPPLSIRPSAGFRERSDSTDGRYRARLNGRTLEVSSDGGLIQFTESVPFRQAFFSRDNAILLTERQDTRARVWDLTTGEQLTRSLKTRYDLSAPAPAKNGLPRETRPTADLVLLAQLLSGSRVDKKGAFLPLEKSQLISAWNQLRKVYPESFTISDNDVLAWHEQEARSCEQAWNWWAALFHLSHLARGEPKGPTLKQREVYSRAALDRANQRASGYEKRMQVIPPRDPAALPQTVDLSEHYTRSLKEGRNSSLANFPSGLQTFDGIPFDVRGVVRLAAGSLTATKSNPERVDGVKVGRKCKRVHFLHAVSGANTKQETVVGRYVVHYANEQTCDIPIVYGKDVMDLWSELNEPLTAERAALVWLGTNREVQTRRNETPCLRMFKATWPNPLPNVEIASIDFVSSLNDTAPFLVAMTTE
jgi:WD40 repeat protein